MVGARLRRARSPSNELRLNISAKTPLSSNERSFTGATQSRPYHLTPGTRFYFFNFAQNLAKRSKPFAMVSSEVA